jgi:DNA replication protein DnaC
MDLESQGIGVSTAEVVARILSEHKQPEHGYRRCLGLLSLSRRHGPQRLEAACAVALRVGAFRYRGARISSTTTATASAWPATRARSGAAPLTATCAARATTSKGRTMMNNQTIAQMRALKLLGFATALEEQTTRPGMQNLGFEERLAMLVEREVHLREERKRVRLLQRAKLKYAQASIEDLDARPGRGIDRPALTALATSGWVTRGDTLLLTGPTGVGKTWLACALAQHACRGGHLAEELGALHASGGFARWLQALARTDVLVLDDWGVAGVDAMMRSDLLAVIDDRAAHKATIITTQLPVDHWHDWLGDATIADAILDRLMQRLQRIDLTGESMRRPTARPSRKASG